VLGDSNNSVYLSSRNLERSEVVNSSELSTYKILNANSIVLLEGSLEGMTADSELYNRYGFIVEPQANKIQIKEAVEAAYGVSVKKVRTMNYGPTRKSRYTKTGVQHGKTNAIKKAIVDVAEGDIIDFYSNL